MSYEGRFLSSKITCFFNLIKKSLKKYFIELFSLTNPNHQSVWERKHLTKIWYIHFPAQTSFAYQNKIGRILKFSPVLELQANILVGPLCTTSWRRNWDQDNLVLVVETFRKSGINNPARFKYIFMYSLLLIENKTLFETDYS